MNQENLSVTIYTPESPFLQPLRLLKEMLSDIWKSKGLIWALFIRDIRADYRQSLLGFLWMFIPVLATTVVWTFLFSQSIIKVESPAVPYTIHVLVGTLIWYMFTAAITQPLSSFQAAQGIFVKLKVPPEAFIISGMLKVLSDVAIRLIILIPVFFYYQLLPPATIILFPFALLGTAIVGVSIGVLMVPIGSLYGDISRVIGTAVALGFYVTPIVFPIPKSGFAAKVMYLNPATSLVQVPRDLLTVGFGDFTVQYALMTSFFLVMLVLGFLILRAVMPVLVERMGM